MLDKTVTLFNFHEPTNSWFTTLFINAHMDASHGTTATLQGKESNDEICLLIPAQVNGETILSTAGDYGVRQYRKPKEYSALEDPSGSFTFAPETDFFVVGNYYSDLPRDETDCMDGFYAKMNAELDDVYRVTYSAFYALIPHFEIGGK